MDNIIKIAHLADIHIQDDRRDEYNQIFNKLYSSLNESKPNIIVLAGDVFDIKKSATPNNLNDVINFLVNLHKIAPIIMIAGNHDTNCNVPNSLDLLTPIVNALRLPNLIYWRFSGVYLAHNIIWSVIATDGDKPHTEKEEEARKSNPNIPHICLFHSEINGSLYPNGQVVSDYKLSISDFLKYDATMGGHIHLRQKITSRLAYCGSLIQQNIGESHLKHGYLLWKLDTKKSIIPYRTIEPNIVGIDIQNDNGFVSIELNNEGNDITPKPIPKNPIYWRLMYQIDTEQSKITNSIEKYRQLFKINEKSSNIRFDKSRVIDKQVAIYKPSQLLSNIQELSYSIKEHNKIIVGILGVEHKYLNKILDLHKENYDEGRFKNVKLGSRIRLLRFEFSDMYNYGRNNIVDFTKIENTLSGINAPNASGKSSFVDALMYAIYNYNVRSAKDGDIIRLGCSSMEMKLVFELDGAVGYVYKKCNLTKNINNTIVFNYKDCPNGQLLSDMKVLIGNYLGICNETHKNPCFQSQTEKTSMFVDLNANDRKNMLINSLALCSFTKIDERMRKEEGLINGEIKEMNLNLVGFDKLKVGIDLSDYDLRVIELQDKIKIISKECNCLLLQLGELKAKNIIIQYSKADVDILEKLNIFCNMKEQNKLETIIMKLCDTNEITFNNLKIVDIEPNLYGIESVDYIRIKLDKLKKELNDLTNTNLRNLQYNDINLKIKLEKLLNQEYKLKPIFKLIKPIYYGIINDSIDFIKLIQLDCPLENLKDNITIDNIKEAIQLLKTINNDYVDELIKQSKLFNPKYKITSIISNETELFKDLTIEELKIMYKNKPTINSNGLESNISLYNLHKSYIVQSNNLSGLLQFSDCIGSIHKRLSTIKEVSNTKCKKCDEVNKLLKIENIMIDIEKAKKAKLNIEAEFNSLVDIRQEQLLNKIKYLEDEIQKKAINAIDELKRIQYNKKLLKYATQQVFDFDKQEQVYNIELNKWQIDNDLFVLQTKSEIIITNKMIEIEELQNIFNNTIQLLSNLQKLQVYNQSIKNSELYKLISLQYEDKQKELDKLNEDYNKIRQQIQDIKILNDKNERKQQLSKRLEDKIIHKEVINEYRKLIKSQEGINVIILENIRIMIQNKINEALYELGGSFKIELNSAFELYLQKTNNEKLNMCMSSGYQKFIVGLAARLTIWRLTASPKLDALFIDEGFSSCDSDNLKLAIEALDVLSKLEDAPKIVFIISHLGNVLDKRDNLLIIKHNPDGSSYINNGNSIIQESIKETKIEKTKPLIDICMSNIIDDPDRLLCKICNISMKRKSVKEHIISKKHIEKSKKD